MPVSIFEPRTLIGVWEQAKRAKRFLQQLCFQPNYQSLTEHIDMDEVQSNRIMASFVPLEGRGKTVARTGFQAKTYTPPKVAPNFITKELDLQARQPGETLYRGLDPAQRDVELVLRDLIALDDKITRREEWMRAQLMFTGQVVMEGDGYSETLDFTHTMTETLEDGNLWSADTAVPLEDLNRWALAVAAETGIMPMCCVMAGDTWRAFRNNAQVAAERDKFKQALMQLQPRNDPRGGRYMCTITLEEAGDIDVYTYPEWYEDIVAGTLTRSPMVPSGKLCLCNPEDSFIMAHGAYIDLSTTPATVSAADRYPRSWYEAGPNQRFLEMVSRPLVAPTRTNAWYIAQVIEPAA